MASTAPPSPSSHLWLPLKEKQRRLREGFPEALGLRVHRALSWLGRAETAGEDGDVRFILLWVGFNSAYAGELAPGTDGERSAFPTKSACC